MKITHNMSFDPVYYVWAVMKQRCTNPNCKAWPDYGGRGIKVCSAWDKFENFFADMGQRPSPIHMLERKNNDGDYEPSNCRWATRSEQQRNRRNNVVIHAFGQSKTATDWLPEAKVSFNTIVRRIRMGIDPEIAISTPRNCL